MHKITKALGIIAIFILLTGTAQASDWPMFHHDARHTGYTTESISDDLELLWSYETGSCASSSPAVANGKVFVGSDDNKVYCLNENTGNLIWSYTTGGVVYSSPAVADGKVFVGSDDNKVYCLDEDDGSLVWSYETGGCARFSPTVANGRVFVGSDDGKVYCLDEDDGSLIWSYETRYRVAGHSPSPAVANGRVFVGSRDHKVYCLDEDDGSLIWSYKTGGDVTSSPAIANGKVFVGSWDSNIYCLNENTGSLIWSYGTGYPVHPVLSSPAVANGKVFVGFTDNKVYCLDEDNGNLIWSYTTGGWVYSSPAVADGKVFVGYIDGKIYCLDENTGKLIWSYETGDAVLSFSSPAVANGKVFVGSYDGKIYCFGVESTPAPVTPPAPPIATSNSPPYTPSSPSGTSSGDAGSSYTFSTSATDPDGDKVQYRFDWGDGRYSSWSSLKSSGSSVSKTHSWDKAGTYYVRAQAKDEQGATSSWSSAKTVTISTPPTPIPVPTAEPKSTAAPIAAPTPTAVTAPTAAPTSTPMTKPTPTPTPSPSASITPSVYVRLIKFAIAMIVIFPIVQRLRKGKGSSSKSAKTAEEWFDLGYKASDAKKQVEYYTKCLELNPKNAGAWNNKGTALGNLERYEEAIRCYDKALEIDPKFAAAWSNKGINLRNLERYEEAIRCYDKALEIDPKFAATWNNKGSVLRNLGKYEEAIRCFDKALEINPKFEKAKNNKKIAEEKLKDVSAEVKKLSIERAIYDPCKRDFIEGQLPRMKEWINRYDPGAYWFALSIQNSTGRAIEEWGVELETSSALKIEKARIEGIDYKIELSETHPEPYKNKYAIGVPKEYGIVIPKGGAQRIYFKLRADKPKTTYEISGVFKSAATGDVSIRAKAFKYLCDTGVSPEAVEVELKKTFSEKDAARLTLAFKTVQELDRMCNQDAKTAEYLDKLSALTGYTEGFSAEFTKHIEEFSRFMEQEQLEYLDDKYKGKLRRFCTNLVDVWIAEFLKG